MIVHNFSTYWLHCWCLCGAHMVMGAKTKEELLQTKKTLKYDGCPYCSSAWISFEIREKP